jgi:hypothetical protein
MIGEFAGFSSPVKTLSPTLFLDLELTVNHQNIAQQQHFSFVSTEVAFFIVKGSITVDEQILTVNQLCVLTHPQDVKLTFSENARIIVIGGEPFPEPRYLWWNFVSSQKSLIRNAALEWQNQRFGHVAGESDYIPLPSEPLPHDS